MKSVNFRTFTANPSEASNMFPRQSTIASAKCETVSEYCRSPSMSPRDTRATRATRQSRATMRPTARPTMAKSVRFTKGWTPGTSRQTCARSVAASRMMSVAPTARNTTVSRRSRASRATRATTRNTMRSVAPSRVTRSVAPRSTRNTRVTRARQSRRTVMSMAQPGMPTIDVPITLRINIDVNGQSQQAGANPFTDQLEAYERSTIQMEPYMSFGTQSVSTPQLYGATSSAPSSMADLNRVLGAGGLWSDKPGKGFLWNNLRECCYKLDELEIDSPLFRMQVTSPVTSDAYPTSKNPFMESCTTSDLGSIALSRGTTVTSGSSKISRARSMALKRNTRTSTLSKIRVSM